MPENLTNFSPGYHDCNQSSSENQESQVKTTLEPPPQSQSIKLRDYQVSVIARVYALIRSGCSRVLVVAIMGAGKTIIASWIMRDAVGKGRRVVFLVALTVLLDQTAETLRSLGVRCTILQADRQFDPDSSVVVASLQTIAARLKKGKTVGELLGAIDLIIVDEAHVAAFHDAYEAVVGFYPSAVSIGLTATPWRLSKQEWLGQKFDEVVEAIQPHEIIKRGGAVPCRSFTLVGALDLDQLRVKNGDYLDSQMAQQACRPEALRHVVVEHRRLAADRPTLMIGSTVDQAWLTAQTFREAGYSAAVIVGETPRSERLEIFESVRRGEIQIICSVGCLTAGFDLPCIGAILYIRATKSKALFFQSAGRGSRPHPGKSDYLLLDFGGNLKRFGNPMGRQIYDISQPLQEEREPLTKTCPHCRAEVNQFAAICPECGFEFRQQEQEEEEALTLPCLNEYLDPTQKIQFQNLRRWRKQAFVEDQSPDAAIHRFVSDYGFTPPADWLRGACLRKNSSQKRRADFAAWLDRHSFENRWSEQWKLHHLRLEFGDGPTPIDCFAQLGLSPDADWQTAKSVYQALIRTESDDQRVQELTEAIAAVRSEVSA